LPVSNAFLKTVTGAGIERPHLRLPARRVTPAADLRDWHTFRTECLRLV
jgi:hypothetical protein